MSKIKLIHGDCLEKMNYIEDKSIDMILCDLPYGITGRKSKSGKWDSIIPFDSLWKQYNRIIKDNGAIVLFGSQPFTSKLINSNMDMYRHSWIWNKDKSGNFMNCKFEPMKVHEDIIVFGKQKVTYNPIMELRDEKNKRNNKPRNNTSNILNASEFYTETSKGSNDYKYPTSIKYFNSVRNGVHPTQKPIELLEYLIRTYSNKNETIVDNTMGSCSTGIACINTNRNFIGIELDDTYFETCKNRVNTYINDNNMQDVVVEIAG